MTSWSAPPGTTPPSATPPGRPPEEPWQFHIRRTSNWVHFWSILQLIVTAALLIIGIIIAVHLNSAAPVNSNPLSNCQSLGGNDPSC